MRFRLELNKCPANALDVSSTANALDVSPVLAWLNIGYASDMQYTKYAARKLAINFGNPLY